MGCFAYAWRLPVTNRVKQNVDQGHLYLKPSKVSYRGVPAWLKLGTLRLEIPAVAGLACTPSITMFSSRRTGELWLSCHHCSIRMDVQHTTLFLKGKWASLKCRYCGSSHSARRWMCVCGLPWHGCGTHARAGFACRTRPRPTGSTSASMKDLPGPSNCRPIPSLLALAPRLQKRPFCNVSPPVSQPRTRAVTARAASSRGRKRARPQPQASDLEAVARLRDARINPVPVEFSQIPLLRREKS